MTKENFFQKAKADGQIIIKTVNMFTQVSKLKLAIRSKKQEREKLLRSIGVVIFDIYYADRKLDSDKISNAAMDFLRQIEGLDAEIKDLEVQAEQVRSEFRNSAQAKPPEIKENEEQQH